MTSILTIFGTRPEAIKLAPVLRQLAEHADRIESVVCVTAQHRALLDQVLEVFGIAPDVDLDLMEENQGLASSTARCLRELGGVIDKQAPDLVLVQGDTTSALAAGLAAHYQKVSIAHVEAGLRTGSRYRPFPEEMNRRLLGTLASYHFAPTERAARALRREGVDPERIFVTGNPGIDALRWVDGQPPPESVSELIQWVRERRTLLVTVHRREISADALAGICEAIVTLVRGHDDVRVVLPVHPNPNVRSVILERLAGEPDVRLVDPLTYPALVHVMKHAYLVLTDSGGLQEEAPVLGKPVLVVREETERVEGIDAGVARLVGTTPAAIVAHTEELLRCPEIYRRMATGISPYGDGHAAERIVRVLLSTHTAGACP